MAPGRVRFRKSATTSVGTALSFSDFTYLGSFSGPRNVADGLSTTDPGFGNGGLTGRRVGAQARVFTTGSLTQGTVGHYLYELIVPSSLASSYAQAVSGTTYRAAVAADWGNIYGSSPQVKLTADGTLCDLQPAILYQNGKLFWAYQYSYNVGGRNDRCLGMSVLNDASPGPGQATAYGPWRVSGFSQMCGGQLATIPAAFATTYLGGKTLALGNQFNSGGAGAPWGITCLAVTEPTTALAESVWDNQASIALSTTEVVAYRIDSRQPETVEGLVRKVCGWADPGAHSTTVGSTAAGATSMAVADTSLYAQSGSVHGSVGNPFYAYLGATGGTVMFYTGRSTTSGAGSLTGIPASGTGAIPSTVASGTSVILGNYDNGRGGVLYASDGTLGPVASGVSPFTLNVYNDYINAACWITTSTGKQGVLYCANLVDTIAGVNYGTDSVVHARYGGNATCPHGQLDPFFQATGPSATSIAQSAWLYDQADFARLALGTLTRANLTPRAFTHWNALTSQIGAQPPYHGGLTGAWFDSVTDRLYLCERSRDVDSVGSAFPLPFYHVFQVS